MTPDMPENTPDTLGYSDESVPLNPMQHAEAFQDVPPLYRDQWGHSNVPTYLTIGGSGRLVLITELSKELMLGRHDLSSLLHQLQVPVFKIGRQFYINLWVLEKALWLACGGLPDEMLSAGVYLSSVTRNALRAQLHDLTSLCRGKSKKKQGGPEYFKKGLDKSPTPPYNSSREELNQ